MYVLNVGQGDLSGLYLIHSNKGTDDLILGPHAMSLANRCNENNVVFKFF